jgi:hypothetical protein
MASVATGGRGGGQGEGLGSFVQRPNVQLAIGHGGSSQRGGLYHHGCENYIALVPAAVCDVCRRQPLDPPVTAAAAIATAVVFTWLGMVLAISLTAGWHQGRGSRRRHGAFKLKLVLMRSMGQMVREHRQASGVALWPGRGMMSRHD